MIHYPTPEQWISIQGGEPLIIANEDATLFEIVHVYRKDGAPSFLFDSDTAIAHPHYGSIIETPARQLNYSIKNPTELLTGKHLTPLAAPATLMYRYHGKPCSERGQSPYKQLEGTIDTNRWIGERAAEGWEVWSITQKPSEHILRLTLQCPLQDLVDCDY